MAAPHGNIAPAADAKAPSASQELYLTIYQRCLLSHLSVLDTEILKLERASCPELPEEVMLNSEGSSYSGLLDEIEKTRAKRARIYKELQHNLQQIQDSRGRNSGAASASK